MLNDKIKNKIQLKKQVKSTWVNLPNIAYKTEIIPWKASQNKSQNLNQPNIEGWNLKKNTKNHMSQHTKLVTRVMRLW
jgi:lipid A disaccharide synthetase